MKSDDREPPRRTLRPTETRPAMRRPRWPGTWWGVLLAVALPVLILTAVAITVLLATIDVTSPSDRIELIKAGLGVGAGGGGVVALALTGRRQWSTENANRVTEHDATERRATELYAKAAEQLGSDKAPVRLAGLYALERLANTHPGQCQTITNVLCAYLRMPFAPDDEPAMPNDSGNVYPDNPTYRQEREVRLTAQTILHTHLMNDPMGETTAFNWGRLDLDLTGATLIDFDLSWCAVGNVKFRGTIFVGDVRWEFADFGEIAMFDEATFAGKVSIVETQFREQVSFARTNFAQEAAFHRVAFPGATSFKQAHFESHTDFSYSTFHTGSGIRSVVTFAEALFSQRPEFTGITTHSKVLFVGTTFSDGAEFRAAELHAELVGLDLAAGPPWFSFEGTTLKGTPFDVQPSPDEAQPS